MTKNSTQLWNLLLKEEYSDFDRSIHNILLSKNLVPSDKIVSQILAYAGSQRGFRVKSGKRILISLN